MDRQARLLALSGLYLQWQMYRKGFLWYRDEMEEGVLAQLMMVKVPGLLLAYPYICGI